MSKTTDHDSHLRHLRERAGVSVRELARQLSIHHTNIVYWEKTGRVAKVELLPQLASLLGVSVEEVLGQPRPKRAPVAPGKLGRLVETLGKLPRRQQDKMIDMIETLLAGHQAKSSKAA
jgi:transcriptional regulator with XRE-family HTH domain